MSKASRNNWGTAAAGLLQGLFQGLQIGDRQQFQHDEREADRELRRSNETAEQRRHEERAAESRRRFEITEARLGGEDAGGGAVNRNIRDITGATGRLTGALLALGPYADVLSGLIDKGMTPDRAEEALKLLSDEQGIDFDPNEDERGWLEMKDQKLEGTLVGKKGAIKASREQLEYLYGRQGNDLRKDKLKGAWERSGSFVEQHGLTPHHLRTHMTNAISARDRRRAKMGESASAPGGGPTQESIARDKEQFGGLIGGGPQQSQKAQAVAAQAKEAMSIYLDDAPGSAKAARAWLNENWVPAFGATLGIMELPPTTEEYEEAEAMAAMQQPQGQPVGGHPADGEIMGMRGTNPQSRPAQGPQKQPARR